MNYSDCLSQLYGLAEERVPKHDLNRIKHLLGFLDNPHKKSSFLHIAGSNGKGTAATQIAKSLELAGHRVGLFTSPHISSFRERICINGDMISEEEVVHSLSKIFSLIKTHNLTSSYFEVVTALAFDYFAHQDIDIAIIETGLGGRSDATNVIQPLLSVITSISLEHTEILGDTIEKIAYEKAGIIKPNTPVVIGPSVPLSVITPIAESLDAPVIECRDQIAKCALDALGWPYDPEGLKAHPPCRFEPVGRYILDTAHNPEACRRLMKKFQRKPHCLFAFSKRESLIDVLKTLGPHVSSFTMLDCDHPRLLPAKELNQAALDLGYPSSISKSVEIDGDQVVVCGSFYMMSEVRNQLGLNDICDPN